MQVIKSSLGCVALERYNRLRSCELVFGGPGGLLLGTCGCHQPGSCGENPGVLLYCPFFRFIKCFGSIWRQ